MLVQFISLLSGVIFAIGLSVSGMINPEKVKGFLDIFGQWDYSLVFVMGGAVGVNLLSYQILKNKKPWLVGEKFLPSKFDVDKKLLLGSAMFGIGWGLIGICPGPAIVNLAKFNSSILLFVVSMIIGMIIFKFSPLSKN